MVRHDAVEAFGNPIFVSNHDNRLEQYKKLVAAAKANGSLFVSQLSHVGRQGSKWLNPNPVSASDVHLKIKWGGNEFAKPRPLEVNEIKEIVGNFADSAYWCWKAGYDGVQVSQNLCDPQMLTVLALGVSLDQFRTPWSWSSRILEWEGICLPKTDTE